MSDQPSNFREQFTQMLREYQAKVAGWVRRRFTGTPDDDYQQSADYREAVEFWQKFQQKDGVDYAVVQKYARELFERYDKADKALDEKADTIIKYLGGGSALIAFGALMTIKTDSRNTCLLGVVALLCLIPSLILASRAIANAVKVRWPRSSATLLPVKFAVKMAEHYKEPEKIDLNLWLMFHPICEAYHFRNTRKAELVRVAHQYYLGAVTLLVLPVIGLAVALLGIATRLPG